MSGTIRSQQRRNWISLLLIAVTLSVGVCFLAGRASAHQPGSLEIRSVQKRTALATPCASWTVVSSPNATTGNNYLFSVDAVSANDVWAVGEYVTQAPETEYTLAMHWNGAQWQVVPSPNLSTFYNRLYDVSAVSSNDVWAVGTWFNQGRFEMLAMHWNGSQWSLSSPPGLGQLNAVTALSSNDVWAVGSYPDGSLYRSRTVHWNGTQWSTVPNPSVGTGENFLFSVDGVSANDVWAGGRMGNYPNYQSLILRWNGTQWSAVSHPDIGNLWSIDALAANDIWAIGAGSIHWNGTAWSQVPITLPPNTSMTGITMVATDDVWATGYYPPGSGGLQTLMRHWDGTTWNEVGSYNADNFSVSNAIAAISPTDIWSVGAGSPGGGAPYRTMIGHFAPDANCATPTHTATHTETVVVTPTNTGTVTPTPASILHGHITWQAIPQPNNRNILTATLTLCSASLSANYIVTTDNTGNFTLNPGVPAGTYTWITKGRKYLANSGTLNIPGGEFSHDFGLQRAGDSNNSNNVNANDFNLVKGSFGKSIGDPGYDERADLDNDNAVGASDFTLLKSNFGYAGTSLNCP